MDEGYNVYSYEVSKPRSLYAAAKLGCHMLEDANRTPEKIDCFFSAHVIEHLPNPATLWEIASNTLKSTGVIVIFTPNGDPVRQNIPSYHQLWGQVHPLLITTRGLETMAEKYEFHGRSYSSPYNLQAINSNSVGQLDGHELLFIAQRKNGF